MRISITCVRGVVAEVSRRGLSTRLLLENADIDAESLADSRVSVPAATFETFIGHALALTNCPSLGLSVGEAAPEFQLMTHFAQALPTLRDAVKTLERYAHIFVSNAAMSLTEDAGTATFSFNLESGFTPEAERFSAELFAALCFRVAAQTFTEGRAPLEVRFRHAAPPYVEEYERVFACPITFSAPDHAILFEASLLERQQPYADSFMADILRDACETLLASTESQSSFAARVRLLLRRRVDLCHIEPASIADELGLSVRSLRRELAREGVTMTQLTEQVRIEAAAAELPRPGVSIKEVANKIGYSEASAFHRAFKRWTGKTPRAYVRDKREAKLG